MTRESHITKNDISLVVGLATIHTALLVISTVAGAKLISLPFGLSASATVLSYTFTFVVLDTIAELYGAELSRFVINMGLIGMILSGLYLEVAAILPPPPYFSGQEAFTQVLSASWRNWLAGWTAYMISQRTDLWIYLMLKRTPALDQSITARAWISLAVGQLVDTAIFVTLAFVGSTELLPVVLGQYAIKLTLACFTGPLVALSTSIAKRLVTRPGRVYSR